MIKNIRNFLSKYHELGAKHRWTSGTLLKGAGSAADPGEISGWEKIAEVVLTSAVTFVDFTGLDINTDKFYKLFITLKNPLLVETTYYLFAETDYTLSNYYAQLLTADGASVSAARVNDPRLVSVDAGGTLPGEITITRDPGGIFRALYFLATRAAAAFFLSFRAITKTASVTNITSLRVNSSVTDGIGIGSILMLCKPRTA